MTAPVSVILVGELSGLIETLDSALAQTRRASEVLFVEDAANPVSETKRDLLAARGVKLVSALRAATPGRMRNVGVMASRSEWVVLLNPGDLLLPSFLEETLATASSAAASFVTTGSVMPAVLRYSRRPAR